MCAHFMLKIGRSILPNCNSLFLSSQFSRPCAINGFKRCSRASRVKGLGYIENLCGAWALDKWLQILDSTRRPCRNRKMREVILEVLSSEFVNELERCRSGNIKIPNQQPVFAICDSCLLLEKWNLGKEHRRTLFS